MKSNRDKQVDISVMRILATLAVLFLHTNNTLSNNAEYFELSVDAIKLFCVGNSLMNWAVPVFFMITGVLLLDENRYITPKVCVEKYVKRIFMALFVFGVPFALIEIIMDSNMTVTSLVDAFYNVVVGESWSHLWYIYSLIGVYLILPLLKVFVKEANKEEKKFVIIILFLFNFCIEIVNRMFDITIAFSLPIESFAVFYVLIGKYLYDNSFPILKNKKLCICLLCLEVFIISFVTILVFPNQKVILGYDSPLICLMAITVFVLLKDTKCVANKIIWSLDRLCFGVYLVHPVFINFVYKYLKLTPMIFCEENMTGILEVIILLISVLMFWSVFVILSFIASWCMRKIPFLKRYIL